MELLPLDNIQEENMSAQLTKAIVKNLANLNTNISAILQKTTKSTKCTLLAVSKTKPNEDIISAYDAGQRHFGENYVDEYVAKSEFFKDTHPDIIWHFIGHLQSNKAKKLVQCLNLSIIETVDSQKLADTLNKECEKISRENLDILV